MVSAVEPRPAGRAVREAIAESWHRVHLSGLGPEGAFDRLVAAEFDLGSSLLVGAAPVLEELEDSLRGSNYSTLLVDRDCRLIRRWCDDPRAEESFEALKIQQGVCLLEEKVGTNALGTVMETQRGIAINGSEHFAEALRGFSCYGHPIRHPLTKRIEGVLDITAILQEASPLLPPIIARAVRDIEQRLLDGSRTSEKSLLSAFQAAAGLRRRAIVAIGEDILLSNQAACDLLSPADLAVLRVLSEEPPGRDGGTVELSLESGQAVSIEVARVSGARRGALLRVDPCSGDRARSVVRRSRSERDQVGPPTLVTGLPGTGRTTRARELAGTLPLTVLRPAVALLEGGFAWARDFEAAMRRGSGTVCLDGIDLLPDELLDLVVGWVDVRPRPHLIIVSGPVEELTGRAANLAGMATVREELLPLSARRTEVPALAGAILKSVAAGPSVHLTQGVMQALAAQCWPGNLRELKAVITHAASRRSCGGLTLEDLPEQYRSLKPASRMTALDQAEHDVIVMALKKADGNKVRAAQELGLSRTTLYARMRSLHITTY